MTLKKSTSLYFCYFLCLLGSLNKCLAQQVKISNNIKDKTVVFGNDKLMLTVDYNKKSNVSLVSVNNQVVIQGDAGIYSMIRTKNASYSTLHLSSDPIVKITGNTITLQNIKYGDKNLDINETWTFTVSNNNIRFDFSRSLSKEILAEKVGFPVFTFRNMDTWEGAYQDYGGLAWFYLFNQRRETYGVHSSSSDFWNSKTGNGLTIAAAAPDKKIAMDYSRTSEDKMAFTITIAATELEPRFDAGTNRRRFVRDTTDVWAAHKLSAGKMNQTITISYFDFKEKYGRGDLKGINAEQVSGVLNTIARIGVIDKEHFGGNSWHTPYGPICLQEQYIAQMGLAINDPNFLKGYQQCLDFYRNNAIKPDGRVWPRWAYTNEDAMPNEFTDKGFYEAQWGYLLDSNPDYVTNVAELYDQTGDLTWVATHKLSCEKALDWIIHRDSNGNGLVEMMTDSHQQKRGSDWIDIIWASYENAFINAKLYHALVLWSAIENQLGNTDKEKYYGEFAKKLKASFNKPVSDGGFWDDGKKCFIHWREKDGSVHGNNMVTPVNFMAIAYGISDDNEKNKAILDGIEMQMQKENLFFWPICLYSYVPGEGNDWQFPFPAYENGDIFLSWGAVAVKAYASYKPELALKYVKNVLAQYGKDGLAFQRYGRAKQDGLGDDILSGNSLSVVGLYQAIYGINPLHNRFYLDPHITEALAGTQLKYNYRMQQLTIDLAMHSYAVSNSRFKVLAKTDFGFASTDQELLFFKGSAVTPALKVRTALHGTLTLDIKKWSSEEITLTQSSKDETSNQLLYQINDLKHDHDYTLIINTKAQRIRSNKEGSIFFEYRSGKNQDEIVLLDR